MLKKILFIMSCLSILTVAACGPSEEEKIKAEIAQNLRFSRGAPKSEAEVEARKALIEKLYKQKIADPLAIEKHEEQSSESSKEPKPTFADPKPMPF